MNNNFVCINSGAKIGANVEIGPFTTIDDNVEIGDGCHIGSNVTILSGARIGKNVTIFPGAVISAIPQDLKFRGEDTQAYIGDNTVLRECVTVNRGTAAKGRTVVGSNCLIGTHVMLQGGALVNKDIPPFVKAAREPISYTGINSIGLHRRGFSAEAIACIQDIYRMIYASGLNVTDAVARVEAEVEPSPERNIILSFIRSSQRGIIRG